MGSEMCIRDSNRSVPTKRRSVLSGMADNDGPTAPMMIANVSNPAPVPRIADFQSRAVPAAKTMVVASTASTAQARNTESARAKLEPLIMVQVFYEMAMSTSSPRASEGELIIG